VPEIHDQLFIAGGWTSARTGHTFDAIDPSTEEVIATVARGGSEDIDDAVAALELTLESLDYPVELGRGVGAAQRVFSKSGIKV
jgi:hypothetical protein